MSDHKLIEFGKIPGYQDLISGFKGKQSQALISLPRSVRLPFIASLQSGLNQTILFVTSKSVNSYCLISSDSK